MRRLKLITTGLALLAAACSSNRGGESQEASYDVAEAPDVSPTAAPGVAFRYSYLFELQDEAIAVVQEAHASRCESLGINRCRITGLQYSVSQNNAVSASLEVKLEPGIARQFGKAATKDVRDASGRIRKTEFTGEDTEPVTTGATREQTDIQERITALEQQLATTRRDTERAQLQTQLNDLRAQLANTRSVIAEAGERLASTPMTFNYYGRGGISGFRANPISEALRSFVASMVTMITVVLQLLAYLLPWALLLALLVLMFRSRPGRAARAFFAPRGEMETTDE
ncbi:MAG: hypothetical protein M3438_06775 [Pseudomonadota bacterium]|nr:hypothetical protein [Sphingomonas sp.]MDQ3478845.1 hypothetical protein [Pseudomonadota bacterium]